MLCHCRCQQALSKLQSLTVYNDWGFTTPFAELHLSFISILFCFVMYIIWHTIAGPVTRSPSLATLREVLRRKQIVTALHSHLCDCLFIFCTVVILGQILDFQICLGCILDNQRWYFDNTAHHMNA